MEWAVEQSGYWTDELEDRAHDLSEYHFGICDLDTDDIDEAHFEVRRFMRDEADAWWATYGWDVTDGEGRQLRVMEFLTRPMVCMVKSLHEDASYSGGDKAWADQLEDEARRFRPKG